MWNIKEIKIEMKVDVIHQLGFSVIETIHENGDGGVFVGSVTKELESKIQTGDQLTMINGIGVKQMRIFKVLSELKTALSVKDNQLCLVFERAEKTEINYECSLARNELSLVN